MDNILEQIQTMTSGQILEAAEMVLPEILDINSMEDVTIRLAALAELQNNDVEDLKVLARDAATNSPNEISAVLRAVLLDIVSDESNIFDELKMKMTSVGHKQLVLGPDVYYLGAFLIAGYIAFKGKGIQSKKTTVTIEEAKDGRRKVTIGTETVYLNPLNPLASLVERIFKRE